MKPRPSHELGQGFTLTMVSEGVTTLKLQSTRSRSIGMYHNRHTTLGNWRGHQAHLRAARHLDAPMGSWGSQLMYVKGTRVRTTLLIDMQW